MIRTRPASAEDAAALCAVINPVIAEGTTTGHRIPFDADRMCRHYIAPAGGIACTLALASGAVAGFQALEWCDPDWQGPGRLPADWAVIASFVSPGHQGRGIGRALWAETLAAARAAGVTAIDATIRADNKPGLVFYASLGFEEYRRIDMPLSDGTPAPRICKRFVL